MCIYIDVFIYVIIYICIQSAQWWALSRGTFLKVLVVILRLCDVCGCLCFCHCHNQKRKDRRRQWRFFKRMCLWERANKAVKERLKKSNLNKRKCLKRHHFNKAMFYARCWFRNTLMERKQDFQRQCVAIASQKKRLYQCNQVQKQDAKHWKLKHGRHLKTATLNVRGCNHLTKRELIDAIMKEHSYDLILLTETNVNSSCWEEWGSSFCFFSSGVDPKVREREMKKREETTISGPPGTTCRSPADFENAGVGIVINSVLMPSLRDIKQINGRILVATFEAQGSPVSFICAYAPHSGHKIEEK